MDAASIRRVIDQKIRSGELSDGMRLPPERELAKTFGASRSSVRDALSVLQAEGLLQRKVGSGTYVRNAPAPTALVEMIVSGTSPFELMQFRVMFEPSLCELIVRAATDSDLKELESVVVAGEQAADFAAFEEWDAEFHDLLARLTRNAFIVQVSRLVRAVRNNADWARLKQASIDPARRARYEADHRAVSDALKARDIGRASRQLREHLRTVQDNLFDTRN